MTKPARKELTIALVGQPNCGKSTLFNAVAGFQVDTGNFAGTSVTYTETSLCFEGRAIRLIDLPGTYSISSLDPAERVTRNFLLSGEVDAIVDVVDSSLLARSLELTLQLIEMKVPMVICLNMMDEAQRKGITLDLAKLTARTGLPAHPVVAVLGTGIDVVLEAALARAGAAPPPSPRYDRHVEAALAELLADYPPALREALPMGERFVALRLLEGDAELEARALEVAAPFVAQARAVRRRLAEEHDLPEAGVVASHRHALVLDLYDEVATHRPHTRAALRERIDRVITTPLGGLVTVLGSLLVTFYLAFFLGDTLSSLLEKPSAALRAWLAALGGGVPAGLLTGLVEGLLAGAAIVLPYLVPLLLLLALYEDTGLLPRIAFLVDGLLHRVGLHGKSVVPLILGYGCNVPAIMATRNLESPRDRLITMLVIPFVTCSARSVIILALAGKYLGAWAAAGLYLLGLALSLLVSFVLSRTLRRPSLGVVMEVPPLRRPYPGHIARKVWLRLREFVVVAWPVILVSSVALSALSRLGLDGPVNRALAPLTVSVLKLPAAVGIALFLGLLRKELTLVMLGVALGTANVGAVLSHQQILVLVTFTMLYIPCVATLAAIWREGGRRAAAASAGLNLGVALLVAGVIAHLPLPGGR